MELITQTDPKSPVSEAFRTIRTNISFSGSDNKLKVLALTSATPDEGKSTLIANLAIVMAQAGYKTLVMDCDFRNPTQHKIFQLKNKGLSNCISLGEDSLTIVQQAEGIERLDILTSGPVAPNPSELLGSVKMGDELTKLREHYDYILIDTPPVLPVTDAAALASKLDGLLLIVRSGAVTPSEVRSAKERIEQAGGRIIGCVLNKVPVSGHHYGYGYGSHYGSNYGYYYSDYHSEEGHEEKSTKNK